MIAVGCGGSDDDPKPTCGTVEAPMPLEIASISPAAGSSVKNADIVETFTVVGQYLQFNPTFQLAADHTAGQPVPSPTTWTITVNGADTVYTSAPIAWQNAPGHVDLESAGLLKTSAGCVLSLPKQMFSYDVTAP